MRLHRILTGVGLTVLVCAPLVNPTPALAWGGWGTGPGISIPLPPNLEPYPQVAQVPIFGGQNNSVTPPQVQTTPQTAQVPNGDAANSAPTFVAPGVERNGDGQLERSP